MNLKDAILSKVQQFAEKVIQNAKYELRQQGHYVTGKTENSFRYEIRWISANTIRCEIWANESAIILNHGVAAQKVPYFPNSGRTKSKYIEALLLWAANIRPELSEKERKSFVFAVAKKAKKEGHPTRGSYRYSKNSRRKDWIKFGVDANIQDIMNELDFNILEIKKF